MMLGSPALAQPLPAPVAQALSAAGIPDSAVGVFVQDVSGDRAVVSHGAERTLNPASTMKLVTTFAALELLGPAYTWSTDLYAGGPQQQDVLMGDLYLRGSGDPKLTVENVWLMLRNLRGRGYREIRGDIVFDRSYYSLAEIDPGRFDDQPTRPYNTPPDALLLNYKAVTLQFAPDPDNRTVRIYAEPPLPLVQITNNVVLTDGPCPDWLSRLKIDAQGNGDTARLTIAGSYPRDCGERARSFSLLAHRTYAGALIRSLWGELGGTITGTSRDGDVPSGARLLYTTKSPHLSEIVRDINKFSNNVMARQLFLTLGAVGAGAPATTEKSNRVVRQWLSGRGWTFPELVMENGSGLSRNERVSARNLGTLLIGAFRSATMPEFMASLPLVAADGTMRKRLSGAEIAGQAHIKTGSLSGVRSIAGYVLDAQGRRMAVVMIVNHANAANGQAAQDALLKWVHQRGR